MEIIVEVKNEILGDSIFWRGDAKDVRQIRNVCAAQLAIQVAKDGQPRNAGMWYVRAA